MLGPRAFLSVTPCSQPLARVCRVDHAHIITPPTAPEPLPQQRSLLRPPSVPGANRRGVTRTTTLPLPALGPQLPAGGPSAGGGAAAGPRWAAKMAAGGAEGGAGPSAAMGDCAEIKSQFRTREGFYKLLPGDATRRSGPASAQTPAPPQPPQPPPGPAAASGPGAAGPASSPPPAGPGSGPALPAVRLSLVRLGEPDGAGEPPSTPSGLGAGGDRVCFNLGRELYFYPGCCRRGSQRVSAPRRGCREHHPRSDRSHPRLGIPGEPGSWS